MLLFGLTSYCFFAIADLAFCVRFDSDDEATIKESDEAKLAVGTLSPLIMVLTFNQGNANIGTHSDALSSLLTEIDLAMQKTGVPDLIFFCEQEATGEPLAKLLMSESRGGTTSNYMPVLFEYSASYQHKMFGFTNYQPNHQSLSILYRKDVVILDFAKSKEALDVFEGKGAVVARVKVKRANGQKTRIHPHSLQAAYNVSQAKLEEFSVAIGCAHLDASDPRSRRGGLFKVRDRVRNQKADVHLLSGDLNYRAMLLSDNMTRKDLLAKLATNSGVMDILSSDSLNQNASAYGVRCNQPGHNGPLYGPTYKRLPGNPSCREYSGGFPRNTTAIQSCFMDNKDINAMLSTSGKDKDLKNGEHQLGYLDRLCDVKGATFSPLFEYQRGLEDVIVSDHIPVLNVVTVTP